MSLVLRCGGRAGLNGSASGDPRRVAIWFDGDEAGDTAGRKLRDRLAGIEVDRLTGIAARDVNDLCVAGDLVNLIEQSEAL